MEIISEPKTKIVKIVDYDITFSSGRVQEFALRPDEGDTELREDGKLLITLHSGHTIEIWLREVAALSRHAREIVFVLPEKHAPSEKEPNVG